MKKIVRLTENDLTRLVKRVIMEMKGNFEVGEKVKVSDGMGTLTIEIDSSTNSSIEGMIVSHTGDFGVSTGGMKMSNVATGNEVTINLIDDTNVMVSLPDTYNKSIKAKIKN